MKSVVFGMLVLVVALFLLVAGGFATGTVQGAEVVASSIQGVKVEREDDKIMRPEHVFSPQEPGSGLKPAVARELLGEGWRYFNAGNFSEAEESFSLAAGTTDRAVRQQATIGMALSAGQQGRYDEGIALLEKLRREQGSPDETLPRLLELYLAAGQLERFDELRSELSAEQEAALGDKLDEMRSKTGSGGLGTAWNALDIGDVEQAEAAFAAAEAQDSPLNREEAKLGLAFTHIKAGHRVKALPLLRELEEQGYKPDVVVPNLVEVLMALGKTAEAKALFPKLPQDERAKQQKRLYEQSFMSEYRRSGNSPAQLARFVYRYRSMLGNCQQSGIFLTALGKMNAAGMGEQAVAPLQKLLKCSGRNWKFRLDVIRELSRALPSGQALKSLVAEQKAQGAPDFYRKEMTSLADALTGRILDLLDKNSPKYLGQLQELLSLRPDYRPLQRTMAWACLDKEDFACAHERFSELLRSEQTDSDAAMGLALALERSGREAEALEFLEARAPAPGTPLGDHLAGLYAKKGSQAYERGDYAASRNFMTKALQLQPDNADARSLLAWSEYELGSLPAAQELFLQIFDREQTVDNAKAVLMVMDKRKDKQAAMDFEKRLAFETGSSELENLAEEHFSRVTYRFRDRCLTCDDSAWLEENIHIRAKEGDPGFSRMQELGMATAYHQPIGEDGELKVSVTTKLLNSDPPLADRPYSGRYYRNADNANTAKRDLVDQLWVWVPEVSYTLKRPLHLEIAVGSTPLNGPVNPLPTARVNLAYDDWHVEVFQRSVADSILSYVGQKDPYSSSTWGRVLETGGEGLYTWNFYDPWWVSVEGGASYLWGRNVADNYNLRAGLSFGRTDEVGDADLSYGIFGTFEHFGRNSDFYTYGHGGYFSPEAFVVAGPFLRYQTKPCLDYWIDAQISGGIQYYQTATAKHYHNTGADVAALNLAGRRDLYGYYKGEEKFGPAGTAKLQGMKLLSDYFALGSGASINTTGEHLEWQALLGIRFFFEPQDRLTNTEDLFWAVGAGQ